MSKVAKDPACSKKDYVVHEKDLPLHCPTDEMQLWNGHPQVYLPIEETGKETCPYCGCVFVLEK